MLNHDLSPHDPQRYNVLLSSRSTRAGYSQTGGGKVKRRLLDLYCGEGLAAWGYWLSGRFSEIVGMDINPKMSGSYSFDFIQGDCTKLTYDFLMDFDFIHASPPCQAYSYLTPDQSKHPRLVAGAKHMLYATGLPHVIENVQGAIKELRPNLTLDGHYVGLPMERRRYFYVSVFNQSEQLLGSGETITVHGSQFVSRERLLKAFGLDCVNEHRLSHLTIRGIEEGIPPAMTKYIAERVFGEKLLIA